MSGEVRNQSRSVVVPIMCLFYCNQFLTRINPSLLLYLSLVSYYIYYSGPDRIRFITERALTPPHLRVHLHVLVMRASHLPAPSQFASMSAPAIDQDHGAPTNDMPTIDVSTEVVSPKDVSTKDVPTKVASPKDVTTKVTPKRAPTPRLPRSKPLAPHELRPLLNTSMGNSCYQIRN